MIGPGIATKGREKTEGEKPFWISYADLMTSLMMLFLVIMVTSLLVVTQGIRQKAKQANERLEEIQSVCEEVAKGVRPMNGVHVDCRFNRIDFGEAGRFADNSYRLLNDQILFSVVSEVLRVSETPAANKWLKKVVVEGYADPRGSYLYNLDLSLKRSHWVMCSLLAGSQSRMDSAQKDRIRHLFLIGGVSFNNPKSDLASSRRVELRLEFLNPDERRDSIIFPPTEGDVCRLE